MDTPSAWSILTSVASMIVVVFDLVKSALGSLAWPVTVLTALFVFKKDIVALLSKLASIKVGGAEASFSQGVHQLNPLASAAEAEAKVAATAAASAESEPQGRSSQEEAKKDAEHVEGGEATNTNEGGQVADPILGQKDGSAELDQRSFYENLLRLSWIGSDGSANSDLRSWAAHLRDYMLENSLDGAAAKDLNEARIIASNSPSGAVLLAWRAIEGILQQVAAPLELRDSQTKVAKQRWRNPKTVMQHLITESLIDTETYDRFNDLQRLRNSVAHASHFTADPADVLEYINRAEELAITLTSVATRLGISKRPRPAPPTDP